MTSILDPERFRFDRSAYERPNFKFRCGRAAAWGKPCVRGPNLDGSCGGTTACAPVRNQNGRYECRRPAIAGGPCDDGPLPDGGCSQCQPPCVPRRTLRGVRGRLGLLALGLVVALVLGLSGFSSGRLVAIDSANPGPLTAGHAGFIAAGDCTVCHASHNTGPSGWIAAVFTAQDVTSQCGDCHVFGGPARQAHNRVNPGRADLGETTCQMCHTEHKGRFANIVEINDGQCATCHQTKFASFSHGHPAFSKTFPYARRTAIRFDHASHFSKHFTDARYAERVPATCLACHSQSPNQRSLVRSGFEQTCAACHGDLMAGRELVLLRLPEFEESWIDRDSVIDACGPLLDEFGAMIEPVDVILAQFEQALDREPGATDADGDAPACGTCHVGTSNGGVAAPVLASLWAPDPDPFGFPTPPPAAAGVVVASLSDDVAIAGLSTGLADVVAFLAGHEDAIDDEMDVVLRDDTGIARDVFVDGNYMVVEIPDLGRDRFIAVDYFVHDGQVLHMFPNANANDNFVAAGTSLRLGVPGSGQQAWQIGAPFGNDLLVVIATNQRLDSDDRPMVESTSAYLVFLAGQLATAEAGGAIALQYRVVATAADDAAAAVIVEERRRREEQRLAEETRLTEEAEAAEKKRLAAEAEEAEDERLAEEAIGAEAEEEDEDEDEDVAEDEDEEDDEFESASDEEMSLFGAFLLDVVADDPDEYSEPMQALILAMAEGGLEPLAELIDERADQSVAGKLLAGLGPETAKRVACAWAANLEYELPAEAITGGWFGDYLELRYKPQGHGDSVARAWVDFAIAMARDAEDDEAGERAIALRDDILGPKDGVGGCTKCHAVSAPAADDTENALAVEWRARDVANSARNLNFSHGIHLRLLDAQEADLGESEKGCRWCHVLNLEADFASGFADYDAHSYSSNFKAIAKDTCAGCHSEGNVREDCQLCHDYHREPSFKIRISSNEE